MLFKNIKVLDQNFEIIPEAFVVTEGKYITYLGTDRPAGSFGREYDGGGKLLMSGFYNAHAHSPMTLMRGYGENLKLQEWLTTKISPFEDKLDSNAVYWGTMLAMAESLQYGIVSTSDMYYFCEGMARAVLDSGAKANISRSLTNFTDQPAETMESYREMVNFYENFHGSAEGKIRVDMSLHAEYTSNLQTARALADYAGSLPDTCMHVHVSETETEHRECIRRHGKTPAAYLADAGIFDLPAIAAHCVYSTHEDLEIFRKKSVTVATNPVSNMKLAGGICDAASVIDAGVNLALGTDSVASNNSLNMMEEMKVLALGNKVIRREPEVLTPVQVLRAATVGGAKAQKREDCGAIIPGNRADIIVVDVSGPNMHPVHSLINNLVYSCSGGDIRMTMVDGRVLYENGEFKTIDLEKTVFEAEKATKRILEKL